MVICVSMKMRMNTRTAGSRLATIIHTGKGLFSPRGLMTQPRLSGAVTENPLGTLSFCKAEAVCCYTEGAQWNTEPKVAETAQGQQHLSAAGAMPYLGIGVLNTVIHKHHDEDRDGHPKVPNYPPDLRGQAPCSEASYPMQLPHTSKLTPSCPQRLQSASLHTRPGKKRLFLNLRRKKAMKKVPAISTSDSKAVLGWPRRRSCPDCVAVLLLSGTSVVAAQVTLSLLLSASESLEPEQPWRGCSWKIWGEATKDHGLNWGQAGCGSGRGAWQRPACLPSRSLPHQAKKMTECSLR